MNRQVPWLRVFVEGVVIVTSILLAFGIQAWWDGRIERTEEAESLEALHADFLGTVEELDRAARAHRLRLEAASQLLGTPEAGLRGLGPDSLSILLGRSTRTTSIDPPVATLQGLIASGRLSLISDKLLRTRLAQWNGLLDDHEGTQELMIRVVADQYSPWLRSHVLVQQRDIRSVRAAANFDALFDGFEFDNHLIVVAGRAQRGLAKLQRLSASAQEIVEMLEPARP